MRVATALRVTLLLVASLFLLAPANGEHPVALDGACPQGYAVFNETSYIGKDNFSPNFTARVEPELGTWTLEMWVRIDCRSHTAHTNPPRHLSLFSYALGTGEEFWVGYRCAEWFNSGILLKTPNEPTQENNSIPHFHLDPGGKLGDSTWHHFALTAHQENSTIPVQDNLTIWLAKSWFDVVTYYLDGGLEATFEHPVMIQQWLSEPDPSSPADGGSLILGQGQSSEDTLHHAYKHYDTPDFEYDLFMTEVRLWSSERTSGEISADWNKRISGMAEDLVAVWPLNCSWEFLAAGGSSSLSGNADLSAYSVSGYPEKTAAVMADTPCPVQCDCDNCDSKGGHCSDPNKDSEYECHCENGFLGNGTECTDIDECHLDHSMCHYLSYCRNNVGSFECVCPRGIWGYGEYLPKLCSSESFTVRTAMEFVNVSFEEVDTEYLPCVSHLYASYLLGNSGFDTPEGIVLAETSIYQSKYEYADFALAIPTPTPAWASSVSGPQTVQLQFPIGYVPNGLYEWVLRYRQTTAAGAVEFLSNHWQLPVVGNALFGLPFFLGLQAPAGAFSYGPNGTCSIATVYDGLTNGGGYHLYVDGVHVASNTQLALDIQTNDIFIGKTDYGLPYVDFEGTIVHTLLYVTALDDAEIMGLHKHFCNATQTGTFVKIALFAFFETKFEADVAEVRLTETRGNFIADLEEKCGLPGGRVVWDPVYAWVADTTQDPFWFKPTGLRVDNVFMERVADLDDGTRRAVVPTDAWIIDFTFTMGTNDTVNVLYLPRTYNNDTLIPHDYTPTEYETFGIEYFPCGNEGYDPENPTQRTTACCLPTFVDNYRPVAPFQTYIDASEFSGELKVCNHSDPEAMRNPWIAPPSNFLPATDYMQTKFEGLLLSDVKVWLVEPYVRIYQGRARLADHELRQHASILGETGDGSHTIKTFLGLAHFSPTGVTKFLDSAASQNSIILIKTDFFTVSMLTGVNQYNFFDYCNMRLHQVLYTPPPTYSPHYIQFVGIAFTLGSQYRVNSNIMVIPLASVLVGKGTFASTANWTHACDTAAKDAIWNNATTRDLFEAAIEPVCSPDADMCKAPTKITQSMVVFWVPLGESYYDAVGDASDALDFSIFVDIVVSVVNEATDKQYSTRFFGQMPLVRGGVLLHCEVMTETSYLRDIADMDIVVGSAGFMSEWDRLKHHENVVNGPQFEYNSSLSSDSIESGLITVIVKGNETFFNMPGPYQRRFSLELEDAVSIHIMEEAPHPGPRSPWRSTWRHSKRPSSRLFLSSPRVPSRWWRGYRA